MRQQVSIFLRMFLHDLATKAPNGSVNALADSFEIPTTLKASLGAAYLTESDWLLSVDVLYNDLENASFWFDQRCAVQAGNGARWQAYL